jgi:hypothetical protein
VVLIRNTKYQLDFTPAQNHIRLYMDAAGNSTNDNTEVWCNNFIISDVTTEDIVDGGVGNILAFKYRIHDASIGRFLSVDPLAREFAWNSPYTFAENQVIDHLDLEGLEKFSAITFGRERMFGTRIEILTAGEVEHINISSRNPIESPFVQRLIELSKSDPIGIGFLAVFSHGIEGQIFPEDNVMNDITLDDLQGFETAVSNGDIKFAEGAQIYFGACNCGTDFNGTSFAQKIADITEREVLAIKDDRVSSHIARKEKNLVFTPSDSRESQFFRFNKGKKPTPAGRRINVLNEFQNARRNTTKMEKMESKGFR